MISATTGLPGAGKTLWTINHVEALRKKENREVYYHGIKDLTLPWKLLEDPKSWFDCPPGSIIVIDEAQNHFPLRGTSQAAPEWVKRTATHRHDGFDIFLITQHPGKIDSAVRKDIEVHRHLMRKFGSNFATVHMWQGIRENCDKTRKDSVSSTWRYPKEAFTWYKSAEVHTHKLRVPPSIIVALLFFVGVGFAWYHFIDRMSAKAAGETEQTTPQTGGRVMAATTPRNGQQQDRPKTAMEYAQERVPRVQGLEHTAPVYDGLTQPKQVPLPAACVQWTGKGCKCFTQTGTPYRTTDDICIQIVRNGIFLDFADPPGQPKPSLVSGDNMGTQSSPPVGRPQGSGAGVSGQHALMSTQR